MEDNRVIKLLNICKNVIYRLMPLGNNTEQIFSTSRELNDIKKALINSKIYRLLQIIDLKKNK